MATHVTSFLDTWAARAPLKPALVSGDTQHDWQTLKARVSKLAGALHGLGLAPNTDARVFVLDKNVGTTVELILASAWAGVACVVGNWRLAPEELAWVINDSKATVLVVGHEFAAAAKQLLGQVPAVKRLVVVGGADDGFEALVQGGAASERVAAGEQACFLQLYTSGTTGFPKGAMLTHAGLLEHSQRMQPLFGFTEHSVGLVPMPLFHVGGSAWALLSLFCGCTTVISKDPMPRALLEQIARYRVTHTFIVPAILQGFMAMPDFQQYDTSSLEQLLYGASPISVPLLEKCLAAFRCKLSQVYGMTELSGVFCVLDDAAHRDLSHRERLASAGKPTPGVELRVVDPSTGNDVPRGHLGEFWVRSGQMMSGYWNQPEATAAAITADGWLKTGDAGHVDEGGFFFITDRIKDMVISGGENVYPAEVERVLQHHPAVADVAVFGVPHEKWGETLRAAVVLKPGQQVSEDELIAYCREHLAGYKRPTQVGFLTALPRNASGKVLKKDLRAPFWEGRQRSI